MNKHDEHYKACAIEPWEIMEKDLPSEQFEGFLRGNVIKYILRYDKKGQALSDVDKVINYAQKLRELLQKNIIQ